MRYIPGGSTAGAAATGAGNGAGQGGGGIGFTGTGTAPIGIGGMACCRVMRGIGHAATEAVNAPSPASRGTH